MNNFIKFFRSIFFRLTMLFVISLALFITCIYFNVLYIYFAVTIITAVVSIFFLANRKEKDSYKTIVFLTILIFPILGLDMLYFAKITRVISVSRKNGQILFIVIEKQYSQVAKQCKH